MKKIVFLLLFFALSLWGQYPEKYANLAEKLGISTAIAITAYNRPDYLKKSLEALAANPESQTLCFLFLLDGGPNAKQKELSEIIRSFHFPYYCIIAFSENLGCERNTVELREFVFNFCGFEKAIILEDDVLIPPAGIRLLLRMHDWGEKNIPHFGVASLCNGTSIKAKPEPFLSSLMLPQRQLVSKRSTNTKKGSYGNMADSPQEATYYQIPWYWAYCMNREVWNKIRDTQLEFLSRFVDRARPKEIDHPAIRYWLLEKLIAAKARLDRADPSLSEILGNPYSLPKGSGQDGVFDVSLREQGLLHIIPVVNRIANIGEQGDHFGTTAWRLFCKDLKLGVFPEDASISEFTLVTRPCL